MAAEADLGRRQLGTYALICPGAVNGPSPPPALPNQRPHLSLKCSDSACGFDFFAGEAGVAFGDFDVELFDGGGGAELAGAGEPVGEDFTGLAFGFEGFEEFADFDGDFFSEDGFEFEAGEAVTADAAADEHGPFVGGATDEAEVGVVGASAAVGAAGHAEEDGFVFEAEVAEGGVDGIHETREGAFGLAEGEAAGGEGDAGVGDGAGAGEADVVGVDDAVFGEDGVDFGLIRGIDVSEDEVGVGSDDDGAADGFGDFAEASAVLGAAVFVVDAAQ